MDALRSPRKSWDELFIEIARAVSNRATCIRRQVGAVAVKNHRFLCAGYNGAPTGIDHCTPSTCLRTVQKIPSGERSEICVAVHAEQNVIVQAAIFGVSLVGAQLYCTHKPCSLCTKMLINVGISEIYYVDGYPDPLTDKLLDDAKIKLCQIH